MVHRLRALGEQGHRAEAQRLRQRQRIVRHRQRPDPKRPLDGEPQRRLTGNQQPQPGSRCVQRLA